MYRSMLFVPAANAKAMAKAPSLVTDAIILDLEDALAPEQKDQGRAAAIRFLREHKHNKSVFVRINIKPDIVQRNDIWAIAAEEPAGIVVPKVEDGYCLRNLDKQIESVLQGTGKPTPPLWAMIETPRGVLNASEIACQHHIIGLGGIIVGTNDLVANLRCDKEQERGPLQFCLAQIILAARAYGVPVFDGVYNNFSDAEGFAKESAQGKALGFDGKTLIHPSQIEVANETFGPSLEEIKQAKAIVRAFSFKKNAGKGAINVGGQMVERMHFETAKKLLAQVDKQKGTK